MVIPDARAELPRSSGVAEASRFDAFWKFGNALPQS
jgi:hypothetical protein